MAARFEPSAQAVSAVGLEADLNLLCEVIDSLRTGLAIFDDNADLVRCNERFCRLAPAIADILTPGLSWPMLLHELVVRGVIEPDIRDRLNKMETRLADGGPALPPLEVEGPSGLIHRASMRQTSDGGFLVTVEDITDRRRIEAAESDAEDLLRSVLDACPANVVMSRVGDGQIIYRSPAATELLGTTKYATEHFASRVERADFVTALLPDGRVDDMSVTGKRPDGARFPCLVSARLIDYRGDEVMVSSTVDISKEVELRRTLAEQREQIFQSEKMSALGELLAGVAHELNNPLSVVVGQALMLREENTDPGTLRRVEKISDAAERCARIVKSFLAMARQQPVTLVPIDIADTLDMAVDALRNSAEGMATPVELDLMRDLPPVRGDAHQLAQVIINLISNADQAICESGIGDLVRISLGSVSDDAFVEIRVSDNGPGIPAEIRRRIFDPLFTTKPVGSGTGLGLALAHRVVTAHDGQLRFEPAEQGGSTFVLRLPVTTGKTRTDGVQDEPDAAVAHGRILVVDDEQDVADLIREVLQKEGFAVDIALTAEMALERLGATFYTLILTDLNMPGIGGRGFYERILSERPEIASRVGFVTGDTMSPQASGFLRGAGCPYLEKPVAPSELRKLAQAMLASLNGAGA